MSIDKIPLADIFSKRLGETRVALGMKKAAIAKQIGVSPQVYQRYEEGRIPSADIILKISKTIKKPVDWLLGHNGSDQILPPNDPVIQDGEATLGDVVWQNHKDGVAVPERLFILSAYQLAAESKKDEATLKWLATITNALCMIVSRDPTGIEKARIDEMVDRLIEKYKKAEIKSE